MDSGTILKKNRKRLRDAATSGQLHLMVWCKKASTENCFLLLQHCSRFLIQVLSGNCPGETN